MKKTTAIVSVLLLAAMITAGNSYGQSDSTKPKGYRNIIRYNLSSPLLFGFDKYILLGYERVLKNNQSFSINIGRAAMPQLVQIISDSSSLQKDTRNTGFNVSVDYRFYLTKENKYAAPHGIYIGPYYSFTTFTRENNHYFKRSSGNQDLATSVTKFTINNIGAELGYQFVLWKRMALDLVLIGPGISSYNVNAKLEGNLNAKDKAEMQENIRNMLTQKFPGLNRVLEDKQFDTNGTIQNWDIGFRYLIHIGFLF